MGKLFGNSPGILVPKGTNIERTVYGVMITVEVNEFRVAESQGQQQRLLLNSAKFTAGIDGDTKKEAATVAVQQVLDFIESQIPASETEPAE